MNSSQLHTMKKMKVMKEGNNINPYLPEEIITNILKRLPVKSLLRFQCVCQQWKNIIKAQSFRDEHLHHHSRKPSLLFGDKFSSASWPQLQILHDDMEIVKLEHACDLFDFKKNTMMISSCNGLLCITQKCSSSQLSQPMLLWNPAIRQFRYVQRPSNITHRLGFGFCSIVNDYKILSIYFHGLRGCGGEVYSLKTGLWKKLKLESIHLKGVTILPGVFAGNGSIFWVGYQNVVGEFQEFHYVLVSYDMAMEVLTLIPSPLSPFKRDYTSSLYTHLRLTSLSLTIHENKLAILSYTFNEYRVSSLIDLWVMEDGTGTYGEECGWTKKFSINQPFSFVARTIWRNTIICFPWFNYATKIKMLGEEIKNIVLVSLTTSKVSMFDICKYGWPFYISSYVESFVPVSNDHINSFDAKY